MVEIWKEILERVTPESYLKETRKKKETKKYCIHIIYCDLLKFCDC